MNCVGHAVRVVIDADHSATVLSVDGIGGGYDHVSRVSMLFKLSEVPMMETMHDLLGSLTGNELQRFEAQRIATLPMRLGGFQPVACVIQHWASWADSLQMISQRLPVVAIQVLTLD